MVLNKRTGYKLGRTLGQPWGTVDARRKAVGSGLLKMFKDKTIGNGGMPTIGIWSKNCTSTYFVWCVLEYAQC